MSSRAIKDLDPRLQKLALQFLTRCAEAGLEAIIIETYRSDEEQNEDFKRGRTTPGPKITDAKGGQSPHNCCLPDGTQAARAFDFSLYLPGGHSLDWKVEDDQWQAAIEIGKSLGLETLPDRCHDYDHFQLPNWRDP